jgi:WD40 repeat protein
LDGIWCFTRQGSSAHLFISSPLIALIIYELLDAGHKNWVLCIAWSPDGKHLVSGSKAGELQCWDPQTGKPSGNQLVVMSLYARIADSSYPTWVGCQFQFWHALEAFRCNSFHLTVSNTMYVVVLLLVGSNSLVVS